MLSFSQFEREFDALQAAFSLSKSSKILDQWFQEFENCDYSAFCKTMKRLQYGERFPTWKVFWGEYKQHSYSVDHQEKAIPGCGVCQKGKIFYRRYDIKFKVVRDVVGCCFKCAPDMVGYQLHKANPEWLHKDRIGFYRTREALEVDRLPTQVRWPQFMTENWKRRHPGKEFKSLINPPDLRPEDDPDSDVQITPAKPEPAEIVKKIFGQADPEQEKERQKNIYKNREMDPAPW